MKLFHNVAHGLSAEVCFVQQSWIQRAGRRGKRKKADSKVKSWISQERKKQLKEQMHARAYTSSYKCVR